ncbi:YbaB/EbfC family nucleoid-associated protein [Saccharomonospora sp. NB11]|uniref:YbaB/EbfC family nucleoid-associated protein n=1 Tax=Saccharomonospora sp. NB11 TaxID=1642298 RepID=UPI0018D02C5F|nr:YbaB/EbfC family nucleoid-associated protein [Saccharomonospora sp. NB11]
MTTAGNTAPITVTSADGLVRATLGPHGELSDLEFAPDAFERTDPAQLADTVLDVVRRAGQDRKAILDPPTRQLAPVRPPRPTPKRARRAR